MIMRKRIVIRPANQLFLLLLLLSSLLLLVSYNNNNTNSKNTNNGAVIVVSAEYVHSYPYLFATRNNPQASYPIQEHFSIEYRDHTNTNTNDTNDTNNHEMTKEEIDAYIDQPDFLYPTNHNHNNSNSNNNMNNTTATYRVVLYYLHWCATCKKFVPTYQKFAHKIHEIIGSSSSSSSSSSTATTGTTTTTTNVFNDRDTNHNISPMSIEIYAISCSPNRKLCQSQNIKAFPTIRLYVQSVPPSVPPNDVESMSTTNIINTTPNINEQYYELPHYTQLNPNKALSILGITSQLLSPIVNDDHDDDDDDHHQQPWWKDDNTNDIATTTTTASHWWWNVIQSYWNTYTSLSPLPMEVSLSKPTTTLLPTTRQRQRRTRDDVKNDIYLSLDYALRNELFRSNNGNGILSDTEQLVIKDFLILLHQTIPSHWELYVLITELVQNLVYIVKSEDYLLALLDEYPTPVTQWSASCSYQQMDEGYTCGLWELFHTITIGVVEYNTNYIGIDYDNDLIGTEYAARTIRNYIAHFFGCTTCRDHFLQSYDTCQNNVCHRLSDYPIHDSNDWMELVFWLYELHNHVNVRLLLEEEQEEETNHHHHHHHRIQPYTITEKIQTVLYPSKLYECSTCWKEINTYNDVASRSDNDSNNDDATTTTTTTTQQANIIDAMITSYQPNILYNYLRHEYGFLLSSSSLLLLRDGGGGTNLNTKSSQHQQIRQMFHPVESSVSSLKEQQQVPPQMTTTTTKTMTKKQREQQQQQQQTAIRTKLQQQQQQQPLVIQLSYAGIFVVCTVLLNLSGGGGTGRLSYTKRLKLKVA